MMLTTHKFVMFDDVLVLESGADPDSRADDPWLFLRF